MSVFKRENPKPTAPKSTTQHKVSNGPEGAGYEKYDDKTYFAFIDVLGFKNDYYESEIRMEGDPEGQDNNSPAEKYGRVFQLFFELIDESGICQQGQCYAGQTSDSLFFYTKRTDFMVRFIKLFSYFSVYAMAEGVFFRGGIGCGNLYCRAPYMFYGQSVINAYLLESVIAKNPVIAVDEDTYEALQKEGQDLSADVFLMEDNSTQRHFINPFAYFCKGFHAPVKMVEIEPAVIELQIDKRRRRFEYDPGTYAKYSNLQRIYQEKKPEFR